MFSSAVRKRTKLSSFAIFGAAVAFLTVAPAMTALAARGAFVTDCHYSHSRTDDPILFPGQPGASHRHDFFGNETTDASSTVRSLRSASTKCLVDSDTAAYWTPTAYLDSERIKPTRVRAYYFGIAKGMVETVPARLQAIAGNAAASTPADNPHVRWFCGAAQRLAIATPISDHPYDCTRYARHNAFVDGIVAKVNFPNCWDGAGTSPSDLTYADHGCPDAFSHAIPRLIVRVHYGIMDPCAGDVPCRWDNAPDANIHVSLSSGSYWTYHADFWNAWHQRPLNRLVRRCLDAHIDCGGQHT